MSDARPLRGDSIGARVALGDAVVANDAVLRPMLFAEQSATGKAAIDRLVAADMASHNAPARMYAVWIETMLASVEA